MSRWSCSLPQRHSGDRGEKIGIRNRSWPLVPTIAPPSYLAKIGGPTRSLLNINNTLLNRDHDGLGPGGDLQLRHEIGHMDLHRAFRDTESRPDFLVAASFRDQSQHFFFSL